MNPSKRVLCAALIAALAVTLASCFGTPDREKEAEELRGLLTGMPGVEDVDVVYRHGALSGNILDLKLDMPTADPEQIGDAIGVVVAQLNGPFEGYDSNDEVRVTERSKLGFSRRTNPDLVARKVTLARTIEEQTGEAVEVGAYQPQDHIETRSDDPSAMVDRLLAITTGNPVTMDVRSDVPEARWWEVRTPITPELKADLDARLARMPEYRATAVVGSKGFVFMHRGIASVDEVEAVIARTVEVTGAGPERPMLLSWTVATTDLPDGEYSNDIAVGSCRYPTSHETVERPESIPELTALAKKLREQYDTCPR